MKKKTARTKPKPSKFTKSNYRRATDGVQVRRSTFDLPEELLHRWAVYVAQHRTTKVAHLRELLEKALPPDGLGCDDYFALLSLSARSIKLEELVPTENPARKTITALLNGVTLCSCHEIDCFRHNPSSPSNVLSALKRV